MVIRTGFRRVLMTSAVAMATVGCGLPAWSQTASIEPEPQQAATQLDDVVVQARRVDERQQSVPIAITTLSAERLEEAAATSVSDLQRLVPSLQIGQDSSGQQNFIIRGSPGGFGNDPAVINYIDEVPVESRTLVYSLFDLASVQALKGSQGTLFGRNSTGGAVLFFSKKPTFAGFGGYLTGRAGNLDDRRLEGALNIPVSDTLAFRISGEIQRRDGLLESVTLPGREYGDRHNEALRASALWTPTDAIENYTQITHYRQREHAPVQVLTSLAGPCTGPATPAPVCLYQPPFAALLGTGDIRAYFNQQQGLGAGQTVNNTLSTDNADRDSITNTFNVKFGSVGLRNILYYGESDIRFVKDYDGTPVRIFDVDQTDSLRTFYTETQLFGDALDSRLDWRIGGVLSNDRVDQTSVTAVFPLPTSTTQPRTGIAAQEFDSKALFAQATYDLSDWLDGVSLTAGYRHTWDDRTLDQQVRTGQPTTVCALQTLPVPPTGPAPFPGTDLSTCTRHLDLASDDYNYNLTLDWKPTDKILLYVAARKGYKSGSFNLLANEANLATYAPETVKDVEVGLKADWEIANIPFRANIAAFNSQYTNIQVSTVRVNPANGDINVLVLNRDPVTGASNEATIKGFEVELLAAPTSWLQLSAFYSQFDSVYDQFIVPGTSTNLAGENVAGVIPETWGVTAQASVPLSGAVESLDFTASYYVRGKPQTNATSTTVEEERTNLDARVSLRNLFNSGADLSVYGKNLGDEIACPINTAVTGGPTQQCGEGRSYGLELTYRFGSER